MQDVVVPRWGAACKGRADLDRYVAVVTRPLRAFGHTVQSVGADHKGSD